MMTDNWVLRLIGLAGVQAGTLYSSFKVQLLLYRLLLWMTSRWQWLYPHIWLWLWSFIFFLQCQEVKNQSSSMRRLKTVFASSKQLQTMRPKSCQCCLDMYCNDKLNTLLWRDMLPSHNSIRFCSSFKDTLDLWMVSDLIFSSPMCPFLLQTGGIKGNCSQFPRHLNVK